jgi:HSP20 family protein
MWVPTLRSHWDALTDVQGLQREINRLFTALSGRPDRTATLPEAGWTPSTDVYETTEEFVAVVELPGIDQKEIEISLFGDTLTVRGSRPRKESSEGEHQLRGERCFGPFVRTIAVPSVVDADRIKATYKDGLLEIRLPKREEAKPRAVPVEAA